MSPAEPPAHPGAFRRALGSELRLVYGRRRNQVLLVVLGAGAMLLGIAVKASSPHTGQGPQFLDRVAGNGMFLVFGALVVMLPVFLPLVVAVVAGDSLSGEASSGTLRYLLTVPVGRTRLLVMKWLAALLFATSAVFTIAIVALITGAVLFPFGRVTLLSGSTVSLADGLLRSAGIAGYVAISLVGLVTIGLAFSTLTEVPVAAMALTLGFVIVAAVLDTVPQVAWLHPYLLDEHWLDFGELLRAAPRAGPLLAGIWVQVSYTVVAGAVAWARFGSADITV
ncbi:MAG TPA: ABC transporter permease [Mycobacteriales bacterium]|nr:ABC transporter permease [Mycobacteriales bacterium]